MFNSKITLYVRNKLNLSFALSLLMSSAVLLNLYCLLFLTLSPMYFWQFSFKKIFTINPLWQITCILNFIYLSSVTLIIFFSSCFLLKLCIFICVQLVCITSPLPHICLSPQDPPQRKFFGNVFLISKYLLLRVIPNIT